MSPVTVYWVVFMLLPGTLVQVVNESAPALCRYSYRRIALPPSEAGAVQSSLTRPLPGVNVKLCGTLGTVTGVAVASLEAGPSPMGFLARTLNLYMVPLVRPVTVCSVVFALAPEMSVQEP